MYDDYDLDYFAYSYDHIQDLDEDCAQDQDEDYVREAHDYQDLAYRHYA
jgi:hypothetical protein